MILQRIISRGLLPLIDVLAVEWHDANGWVFGGDPHYKALHECIDWFVGDTTIQTVKWGR
jgi:hypothetical protein